MLLPQKQTTHVPARPIGQLTFPRKPIRRTGAAILIFIALTKKPLVVLVVLLWFVSFCNLCAMTLLRSYTTPFLNLSVEGSLFWFGIFSIPCLFLLKKRSFSHGSARFATLAELHSGGFLIPARTQQSYLPLGTSSRGLVDVGISEIRQQSHVLLVAPTGKRKTSGIIIPSLLSEQGRRSLIINDVKGELIEKTAGALSQRHDCFFFCPTRPRRSHQYNPLMHISTLEDAQDFAHCWVTNTGTSQTDPFWDRATTQLMMAIVLHLRIAEPNAPLSRLGAILCGRDSASSRQQPLSRGTKGAQVLYA